MPVRECPVSTYPPSHQQAGELLHPLARTQLQQFLRLEDLKDTSQRLTPQARRVKYHNMQENTVLCIFMSV